MHIMDVQDAHRVHMDMLWMPSAHIMDVMSVIGRHVKNVSVHTGTKDL